MWEDSPHGGVMQHDVDRDAVTSSEASPGCSEEHEERWVMEDGEG